MVEWIQAAQEVQVPDTSIKHMSIIFQSLSVIGQLMILPFSVYLRFSVLKSKKRHEARSVQLILCSPGKLCSTNSCDRDQAHGTKTFQLDWLTWLIQNSAKGPACSSINTHLESSLLYPHFLGQWQHQTESNQICLAAQKLRAEVQKGGIVGSWPVIF